MAVTRPYLMLFGRVALATGLPFGIIMGLIMWPFGGRDIAIWAGVFVGVAFGVSMGIVLTRLSRSRLGDHPPAGLGVRQRRELRLAGSREQVLHAVTAAMGTLPRARPPSVDAASGSVTARVGTTWWSSGEVVSAQLSAARDGTFLVVLESRPRWITTVIDYGKNAENLEHLVMRLTWQ